MLSKVVVVLITLCGGLSADYCNVALNLHQELLNDGFHRNLTYKLIFESSHLYNGCRVALDQRLPAGVYAAPDELRDLMRLNKLTAIPLKGVNIELPAKQAKPTSVFIIGRLLGRQVDLWLPVHARYHHAVKGGGYINNEIDPPRVLLNCPHVQFHCQPPMPELMFRCTGTGTQLCIWKQISVSSKPAQAIQFPVPVGNTDHTGIVMVATLCAVLALSLYLLKTIHDYKMSVVKKNKNKKSR